MSEHFIYLFYFFPFSACFCEYFRSRRLEYRSVCLEQIMFLYTLSWLCVVGAQGCVCACRCLCLVLLQSWGTVDPCPTAQIHTYPTGRCVSRGPLNLTVKGRGGRQDWSLKQTTLMDNKDNGGRVSWLGRIEVGWGGGVRLRF